MRLWLKHIILLLLLPAFLLFASGVGVMEHSCAACGTVAWTHTQAMDCCGVDSACSLEAEEATCCAVPSAEGHDQEAGTTTIHSDECCSFEKVVLVIDETFVPETSRISAPLAVVNPLAASEVFDFTLFPVEADMYHLSNSPPGKITGIAFLIFTQQLKIACLG